MKKTAVVLILTIAFALTLTLAGCGIIGPAPTPSVSPSASASSSPSASASTSPSEPGETSTAPADASGLTLADYFPFKENVHMTYAGFGNEYAAMESWVDYVRNGALQLRRNNGGTEVVNIFVVEDGALKRVFLREETYYRQDFTAMRAKEEILIMEPLEVGTTWTLADGSQRSITATNAAVTVPYGTFAALEVTTVYDGSTGKSYYAPGLGLVKSEFVSDEAPSDPVTSELENYEEGSPLLQYAHFYYPDFNNERVAYIEKTFELYTNDDITAVFEREFKTVPEGSGLTPLMPADAALNSVSYDPGTGVVTADVSGRFVTGMNAGASLEGLILQSVADTLGWYFQTDKVQLTVDGGPYESGHFLFSAGEYLPYDLNGTVAFEP